MNNSPRWTYALKLSFSHFAISIIVAALSALLVWHGWYIYPYHAMLGISGLYFLIIIVDVICGPLLTFVIANPLKRRQEIILDLSLIALIQISALLYGLYTLHLARPVAVAFEADRLVLLTANEIYASSPPKLPFMGVRYVNVRKPKDGDERLKTLELTFQGINPSMMPKWWEPYSSAKPELNTKAKPLSTLVQARPHKRLELQAIAASAKQDIQDLRYIPFVSSKDLDWIAILDEYNNIVGYANIDGFIQPH